MLTTLIVLAFLATAVAFFSAGIVVSEWRLRKETLLKLTTFDADWKASAAQIAAVHNQLGEKVMAIQEQLASHEMRLTGMSPKAR